MKVKDLRYEYERACEEGKYEFEFQGATLLTKYAKYLLEYLEDIRKVDTFEFENK